MKPVLRAYWMTIACVFALVLFDLPGRPSFAQTPPAGGLPSASRLQEVHDLGQRISENAFHAETLGNAPPTRELMRYRLDDYMKQRGSELSEMEKDVLTQAYWEKFDKKLDRFGGGMTQIDPPSLQLPNASTTTVVSGKTATPGPGTLQLSDKDGNTYFVDVDQNGNYSRTVPQGGFQPVKMTLRTAAIKAAWELNSEGTWTQVSSAAMPGGSTRIGGAAAYALLDECNRPLLVASWVSGEITPGVLADDSQLTDPSPLHLVSLFLTLKPAQYQEGPPVHLVNDPLPPEAVREAQKQGIDHADQQFEKAQLEKIPKASRTQAQNDRLDKLNDMLKDYDNAKNSPFANKEATEIAEKAAQARWLQRQAEAIRASGAPGAEQSAQSLLNQAHQLMGGQALPPLRASAGEPLQFSSASTPAGSASPGTRIVQPGQSGYAMLGSPATSVGGQGSLKGHSRLVATGEIRKQTTTELELDQLAQLEEEPSETSSFAQYFGYNFTARAWGKENLSIGAQWSALDEKPANVTAIGHDGLFELKDWKYLANTCYRLNLSYGFDHVSVPVSPQATAHTYEMIFNTNPYWIAGFKTGIDIDRFQTDYMKAGQTNGAQYTWTHWHTPFPDAPMISSGQVSDAGYNHLAWASPYQEFMAFGELSPGTRPLPVSGLNPADWPKTAADRIPVLILTGVWLEE